MSCPERYLLFRFGWTGEKLVDLGLVTNITDMMPVGSATVAVPGKKVLVLQCCDCLFEGIWSMFEETVYKCTYFNGQLSLNS